MIQISDLRAGMNKVTVEGKIESIGEPRVVNLRSGGTTTISTAILSDSSGKINLDLWGKCDFNVGDKVSIQNGYVKSYKGETSLDAGKFGKMVKI